MRAQEYTRLWIVICKCLLSIFFVFAEISQRCNQPVLFWARWTRLWQRRQSRCRVQTVHWVAVWVDSVPSFQLLGTDVVQRVRANSLFLSSLFHEFWIFCGFFSYCYALFVFSVSLMLNFGWLSTDFSATGTPRLGLPADCSTSRSGLGPSMRTLAPPACWWSPSWRSKNALKWRSFFGNFFSLPEKILSFYPKPTTNPQKFNHEWKSQVDHLSKSLFHSYNSSLDVEKLIKSSETHSLDSYTTSWLT